MNYLGRGAGAAMSCPNEHSVKETRKGGWSRQVECPCDNPMSGHDGDCRCAEHGVTWMQVTITAEGAKRMAANIDTIPKKKKVKR